MNPKSIACILTGRRCFLYLVNYARIRPEIAVKAIPVLQHVRPGTCYAPAIC